ncbi:MAG: iron ABC transporter permease [Treponema sp.]|nr:iron ABC transporter permease [Treponema sp.]
MEKRSKIESKSIKTDYGGKKAVTFETAFKTAKKTLKLSGSTPFKPALIKLVWAGVCLFIFITILTPLLFVFASPAKEDFIQVFTSNVWKNSALHTLIVTLCSTTASVLIGYIYAYAVVKENIPCKRFFSFIPFLHLVTPPFVGGLAFILLLGRQGFITKKVLGLDISLYGFTGLLIAQVLCFFPMAYIICAQTFENINPSLEQVSKSLGAGKLKTFFKITLPLSMPGIISSALYIAVSVMSDFGNPMIVAGRYKVLAVEIYTQLTGWMNGGASAVLGIILVIPSIILFILQNKYVSKNMAKIALIGERSQTAQKSQAIQKKQKFSAERIILTVFCSFITLCVLLQFASIIAGTFQKVWGINFELTPNHIKNIGRCKTELINSVRFALEAAALCTLISCFASYFVFRSKLPLKKFIDTVIQLPAAIPGTLFGLAISLFAAKINFHLSNVLIVIAITIGFIPFSYRAISASFSQIKKTLDDGARSLGAGELRLLFYILIPLAKEGLFNSFIYDFVRGVGTMSAVIFLVSFDTPLSSIKILNLAEQGFWGDAAALALVLTLITFAILLTGRFLIKFWGRKNG